ncbi:MAG TPA: cell division protein FtsQ/DivIB [Rhodocyclaceae bacterium]|nr:cell division protein FtsQ/DivIB [Rhodocyclaceae bacterium]
MAKVRRKAVEPAEDGFWDRPVLMNLVADLLIVLAIAGLAWAGTVVLQRLPFFPLRQVVVNGQVDQVTRAQIEQATRATLVGNFFTIELDEVRAAFEKLPWVRHADVRRRWPNALELTLEEHVAVARWQQADGESRLVNGFGEVFAAASQASLPAFSGPEGSAPEVLGRYREFEKILAPLGRKPEAMALSSREAWQVKLDDGVVLELGRDEAKYTLTDRMARFTAYYRPALEKVHLANAGVVDMRYPNGFALRAARKS